MNKQLNFNFLNKKRVKKEITFQPFFFKNRIACFISNVLGVVIVIAIIFSTKQIFTKWIFQR
jgi:hypothetical protein